MEFVFLDFETLSNISTKAPVISMGAIAGNWKLDTTVETLRASGFYRNVSPIRQITELGLRTNKDTLDWWSKQGTEAQKVLEATDKVEIEDCLDAFTKWCIDIGVNRNTQVFIRAPHFDWTIYENLMRLTNRDSFWPLSHWAVRDSRTICDMVYQTKRGQSPLKSQLIEKYELVNHNAKDDCILDFLQVAPWFIEGFDPL